MQTRIIYHLTALIIISRSRSSVGKVLDSMWWEHTFDFKFCHGTGIARSEGRGQGQHNKLCLAGLCYCGSIYSNGLEELDIKNPNVLCIL